MPNFLVSLPGESLSLQDFDESAMCRVDKSIDTCFKSRVGLPPDCPLRPELREDFEFVIASCHGPRARFSRNFRDAAALPHWDVLRQRDQTLSVAQSNLVCRKGMLQSLVAREEVFTSVTLFESGCILNGQSNT